MTDAAASKRLGAFRGVASDRLARINLGWLQLEQGAAGKPEAEALAREIHTLKGEAGLMGFAPAAEVAHAVEDLVLGALRGGGAPDPALGDVILRGLDLLGTILSGAPGQASADAALYAETARGLRPTAPAAAPAPVPAQAAPAAPAHGFAVRVSADQLDRMRAIIAELLLARARLSEAADVLRRPAGADLSELEGRVRDDVRALAGLIGGLDQIVRELGAIPVGELLGRYPRAVRELARELGKTVKVELAGEAVQADRQVLEALADPLLHLVRNAVDHGIEAPGERARAGKPEAGTLRIAAESHIDTLVLEVADDGAGIDVDLVRRRAVEHGLMEAPSARELPDEQVLSYLFASGFSTRKTATQVSGRGVGLDVVRAQVEAMRGAVAVESRPGQGTSFRLRVPVRTSITPVLLLRVGNGRYALPSSSVAGVIAAAAAPLVQTVDGPAIDHAGELIPRVHLPELLGEVDRAGNGAARLVLVHSVHGLLALAGSTEQREREALIKPAGALFHGHPLVAGGVDLEDGSVALVLDIVGLASPAVRGLHTARADAAPARVIPGARILVVEDSAIMRDIIAEALRAHGVEVLEAGDGVEALEVLARVPEVRLLVTDLEMPRIDGFELIRRVRKAHPFRLPAVVVSTRGTDADKLAALQVGADAYVVKSEFTRDGLWAQVARYVTE